MEQHYENYSKEDLEVWQTLYKRQVQVLSNIACPEYVECLDKISSAINGDKIPDYRDLNKLLDQATGWSIAVVPGLIPVELFFEYLSQKKFSASTWLRKMSQLDYLEEPDMFHDIFGHIPLLLEPKYASFMEEIGKLGVKYKAEEKIVVQLQRLYWFTIEFGLVKGQKGTNIYGAGIASSYGECHHVVDDDIEILPFDLKAIFKNDFINSEIQNRYYRLNSLEQLYESIGDLEHFLIRN